MRRKVLSVLLSCAIAFSAIIFQPANVMAVDGTTGSTDPDLEEKGYLNEDQEVLDEEGNIITQVGNDTEIGVYVNAVGGEDILFSIHIDWGEMRFKYNFGTSWDPVTHSYHGATTSGWMKSYADGTNNKIEVFNNSNYPVHAVLTYKNMETTTFNRSPGGTYSVDGGFALDNADLLAQWDNIRGTLDLTDPDTYSSTNVTAKPDIKLDMCTDALVSGDMAYSYEDEGEDNDIKHYEEVYFAMFGTPDRTVALGATEDDFSEQTGTITVQIKPAEPAEVYTYQVE